MSKSIDLPEVLIIPKSTPDTSPIESNKCDQDVQTISSTTGQMDNTNQQLKDFKNTSSSFNYNDKKCTVVKKHKIDLDTRIINYCSPSKIPKIESTFTSFINLSNSTVTSENHDNINLSNDNRPRLTDNPSKFPERVLTPVYLKNPQIYYQVLDIFPDVEKNYLTELCNKETNLTDVINIILEGNSDNSNGVPLIQQTPNKGEHSIGGDSQQTLNGGGHLIEGDDSEVIDLSFINCSDVTKITNESHSSESEIQEKQQKSTVSFDNSQLEFLIEVLPDADPSYLQSKSRLTESELREFLYEAMEKKNYPRQTVNTEQKVESSEDEDIGLYTTAFDIEHFLQIFPEPFEYFMDENRICAFSEHGYEFLKRKLRNQAIKIIHHTYKKYNYNMARTYEELESKPTTRATKRSVNEIKMPTQKNLPFLQEACFVEHKAEIKSYIESKAEAKRLAFEQAKERGELIECGCCFDDAMFEDCGACNEGDLFCKNCIKRSAEVRIGDGENTFPCLQNCGSQFSLQLLQGLLNANMFSRLLKRIQLEEVRAADIEGLEVCPFCEFATIPPPETSIFTCLNPECLKESCRKCHKMSHIPQRCEELEDDDQARARKYIEDEMTKALVRECYKCKKSFIKMEGCNKMTCTCGAKMCYICRQPVVDYKHFNGPGGSDKEKCPLYSTDKVLHVDAVKVVAEEALKKLNETNPSLQLKHDPTKVLPTSPQNSTLPSGMQENEAALLRRLQERERLNEYYLFHPARNPLPARDQTPPRYIVTQRPARHYPQPVPHGNPMPRCCNAPDIIPVPNCDCVTIRRRNVNRYMTYFPRIPILAQPNVHRVTNHNAAVPNPPLFPINLAQPNVPRVPNHNPIVPNFPQERNHPVVVQNNRPPPINPPLPIEDDYVEQLQRLDDVVEQIRVELQQDAE